MTDPDPLADPLTGPLPAVPVTFRQPGPPQPGQPGQPYPGYPQPDPPPQGPPPQGHWYPVPVHPQQPVPMPAPHVPAQHVPAQPAPAQQYLVHQHQGQLPVPQRRPAVPVEHRPAPVPTDSFEPVHPVLVSEAEPVRVSVDNNRCHIYGICQQEAPEVFRISEGGSLHYTRSVPAEFAAQARQAVRCCPMQAIAIRGGDAPGGGSAVGRGAARPLRSGTAARSSRRRIVVAGGGLAGLSAATRLRDRGFDGELVLVGEESRRPYSRPPLSKQYLAGVLDDEDLTFRADETLDAHWLLDTRLIGLDVERRTVELRGGERLPYDGLVLATGVDAKRLPEAPVFSDRVRTIRTVADAEAVRRAMHAARAHHVVILGGGFVGCELACTAREHGMDVTLVVHSAPLLRRVLGKQIGTLVGDIQRRAGVDVRLGTEITDWQDHGDVLRLRLDDGAVLDCDFVVLGLGSEPRTEWLRGSGLDVSDGVLCDPTCHAVDQWGRAHPNIVAAGDVARWPNARFDSQPRRVEHLIHAVEMGQHAADSLLRGPDRAARFTPVPRFWSEQHGTRIQAVGSPALGKEVEVVEGSLRSERFVARYTRATDYGPQTVAVVAFDMPLELLAYRDEIGRTRPHTRTPNRRRRR
ncbi:FAD-dependent oxidoreductase [Streptacidiphilus sp. N1-10]|uniref:FAD-dependent oxidoreductase n=1 Tax=Streptacidiphilus jeojiensis TaxID=3229225 RepID=A0ABV6XQI8_9ACTN